MSAGPEAEVTARSRLPSIALVFLVALLGLADAAVARPSPGGLEIPPAGFSVAPASNQAGAHADLTIVLELAHDEEGHTSDDLRTAVFDLPAGFVGNAGAVPRCTQAEFLAGEASPECPPASQVGTIDFEGHIMSTAVGASLPLYNLVPNEPGRPAELGFRLASFVQLLPLEVRSEDGGLTVSARDVSAVVEPRRLSIGIWGVPADPRHDAERRRWCLRIGGEPNCDGGEQSAGVAPKPFLANPTSCGTATAEVRARSWEEPERWSMASAEAGLILGCEGVPFEPSFEIEATDAAAGSPTALAVSLRMPTDWVDPAAIPASALRTVKALLPSGFVLNPAYAAGLREGAVVGVFTAWTPMLEEPARGRLYLGQPLVNGSGVRVPLHAVAEASAAGVRLELAAELEVEAASGRTTISIEEVPQLPFDRLDFSLGEGGIGPFVSPEACGDFEARVELVAWSAPGEPRVLADRVSIDRGAHGPCLSPADQSFQPELSATSRDPRAGDYSPFKLSLSGKDGEAPLTGASFRLPAGLAVRLAGVGVCPAAPFCPPDSYLGRTSIEVGAGTTPARLPGSVYLAGPYGNAPLSLALVTPARLGPFDLGTIAIRQPLELDPRTGAVIVGSGERVLPEAIAGIPLRVRGLTVDLDRPELFRNPTSCRPLTTTAVVAGTDGAGEGRSAVVSSPYRAQGCRRLRFAPSLRLDVLGATERNGHPGLRALFVSHSDEANLAGARISMPPGLMLDPSRLDADRAVGWARATSPLLGEALRGRLYLRRSPHAQLPALVAHLHNRDLELDLVQRLRMGPGGVAVVAREVPDLPISKLVLVLSGGSRGLLVNSVDLEDRGGRVAIEMVGHNGKVRKLRTRAPAG